MDRNLWSHAWLTRITPDAQAGVYARLQFLVWPKPNTRVTKCKVAGHCPTAFVFSISNRCAWTPRYPKRARSMKGHKVGIQIAMRAMAHVTLKGWASEKSLSEVIPCSDRTAARIIAYLKSEGWVVKSGYGVIPAAKHSATEAAKHSATNTSNGGSGKDSATNIPPPQIPVLLNNKECPEIAIANRQSADSLLVVKNEHLTEKSRAIAGPVNGAPDAAPTLSLGPPNEVATHQDADDEQPSGIVMDKEQAEAVEDYEAWRDNRKPPSEITGAPANLGYSLDENLAAYQEDLDKLVGVISREVDARKLANRKLGEQRKNRKITAGAVHTGKQEWRQLRDIGVELAGDRASGELRYAAMQTFGYRLDGLMAGWREKMAIDPAILRGYEEQFDQWAAEQRAQRKEEERQMWRDAQEAPEVEADLGESDISELLTEPATANVSAREPISTPAPAAPVTAVDINAMPADLSWPEKVVWFIAQGEQNLDAIAAAIDQPLGSVKNVIRSHGDIETRRGSDGRAHYYVPSAQEPQPTQEPAAAPKVGPRHPPQPRKRPQRPPRCWRQAKKSMTAIACFDSRMARLTA